MLETKGRKDFSKSIVSTLLWSTNFSILAWWMLYHIISAPRPECTSDYECPTHLACIREKCQDPCQSHTCGINAECMVRNHRALCVCLDGFVGDPFTICEERKTHTKICRFISQIFWQFHCFSFSSFSYPFS